MGGRSRRKCQTAFGYIRVSSQGQIGGDGFTRQEQAIGAYAAKHNIKIGAFFREEGISGTADESARPAFKEMIAAILRNGTKTVIIEGLDRLAREYRIQETLIIYLASKGINLFSARTEENVTEAVLADPMRKALVQIQGIFSELEKSLLVKKLKLARENKKATTGKCEGRKGYQDKAGALSIVKEIKRLRRKPKGRGAKRKTYQQIADIFNTDGKTTMDGKPFTAKNVAAIMYRH